MSTHYCDYCKTYTQEDQFHPGTCANCGAPLQVNSFALKYDNRVWTDMTASSTCARAYIPQPEAPEPEECWR